MNRFAIIILLIFSILFCFSQKRQSHDPPAYLSEYRAIDKIYRESEKLSLKPGYDDSTEAQEARMNQQSLNGFLKIALEAGKDNNDSIVFHCYYKIGILEHYFDSLARAQVFYLKAIALKKKGVSVPDSFLFGPYLFSGSIYYSRNQFDSALINFKEAEIIVNSYKGSLQGVNRLYNALGALYNETGNYSQAKNYFEKAAAILSTADPFYTGLLVNYRINLASVLTKLEEYDKAASLYASLLAYETNTNEILHNIGTIYLNQQLPEKALLYFRKVLYTNDKEIRLLNDIGLAYSKLNRQDSARFYFQKAMSENQKWNQTRKNVSHGLTLKYTGDLQQTAGDISGAIEKFQEAIIQFDVDFNSTDIHKNPSQYSGIFSYINLFYALVAKADALELFYRSDKNAVTLEASLDAYRSAFSLADYVERNYDSDEARLFLNKIKYFAHIKPIDISLRLLELTQNKKFLEEAFLFDQRNKATILTLNVEQNTARDKTGNNAGIFTEQSALRSAITRLSLKASVTTDSLLLAQISASIRDNEIQLGKLQDRLNEDPYFKVKQATERIPSVHTLQGMLDPKTVLLSYHLSGTELIVFIITAATFEYSKTLINEHFPALLDSLKVSLHNLSGESRYAGSGPSMELYKILIGPVKPKLRGISRMIIIPDDELNYLPFEALENENKKYLLEDYSIQYQYSATLLENSKKIKPNNRILAFAPFIQSGYTDSSGQSLSILPASKDEISSLKGNIYTDSTATKANFLNNAGHYGIIHLATHAMVNNEFPLRSYIVFYPGKDTNRDEHRLYAQEIYNLNLDSAEIVILSACETGTGKLIKGEGLMSLSRAFAYAGCSNIITSLWQSEDKTTAYIMQKLHRYLDKGYTKDRALQMAKLDLLQDNDLDPRFKSPNYWSQLLFIGNYEPLHHHSSLSLILVIIGILSLLAYIIFKIKKPG